MEKQEYEEYKNNPFACMSSREICNKLISMHENCKSEYNKTIDIAGFCRSLYLGDEE